MMLVFQTQCRYEPVQLMANLFCCNVSKANRCLTPATLANSALQAISAIGLRKVKMAHIATKAMFSFGCIFHRAVCHYVDNVYLVLQHFFSDTHHFSPLCVTDVGIIAIGCYCVNHSFLIAKCSSIALRISETWKLFAGACAGLHASHRNKCGRMVKAHLFISVHSFFLHWLACGHNKIVSNASKRRKK